jgi:hypothetical protein
MFFSFCFFFALEKFFGEISSRPSGNTDTTAAVEPHIQQSSPRQRRIEARLKNQKISIFSVNFLNLKVIFF